MYPRVVIDEVKLYHNAKYLVTQAERYGVSVYAVTKVFCATPRLAQVLVDAGVSGLADSRIQNIKKMRSIHAEKMYMRVAMPSEVDDVVRYADVSLHSELETIRRIDAAAQRQDRRHRIVVMFDLGDLREGFLPEALHSVMPQILAHSHIRVEGIGVNLTCYGGVIPTRENLTVLTELAQEIERTYGQRLTLISGGASSSLYLLLDGQLPTGINHLRIGEGIVLGTEAAFDTHIEGTYDDAFVLEAEIIELKRKGSVPIGTIGNDAFGGTPVFEDKGEMVRAILAIGRQDVDFEGLTPIDEDVEILGASSDHMLMDVTHCERQLRVGDVLRFKMRYSALLKVFTSEYVEKVYATPLKRL